MWDSVRRLFVGCSLDNDIHLLTKVRTRLGARILSVPDAGKN